MVEFTQDIYLELAELPFAIWFLIGAVLVFFMQAGFAMVETGFTRAKNAGNILMKNLMDFCIGTVMFVALGAGILMGESMFFGLIGRPDLQIFTDYANFNYSDFVFNLVFCATAATIVSGAMAERTKFSAYCIYSAVISLIVYPVEAHWLWGGGWLDQLGYIDFAGSSVIHMVGGITSFIGASILGPRIGKYVTDKKSGKKIAKAIPGHSLTLGALGCFILWFGWYGFNGAAAKNVTQLGSILLTTTIAPAIATCVAMSYTWIKNGKPDISMSLNGALGGLVAITACCANVDALGATIIGAVAGFLVVFAVEFIDMKLYVDDPVGAIAVHGVNGIWGTIAVALFANPTVMGGDGAPTGVAGLFYGGGFTQLGIQLAGVVAIASWTIVTMFIVFKVIKKFNGLRVEVEDEVIGLDMTEHGLAACYSDFVMATPEIVYDTPGTEDAKPAVSIPIEAAIPVQSSINPDAKMTKIAVVLNQTRYLRLQTALEELGVTGMTVTNVLGFGIQKGNTAVYRGVPIETRLLPKVKAEVVISKLSTETVLDTIKKALYTGNIGDGKIFVYDVENVVRISTGEEGFNALQDVH